MNSFILVVVVVDLEPFLRIMKYVMDGIPVYRRASQSTPWGNLAYPIHLTACFWQNPDLGKGRQIEIRVEPETVVL